MRISDSYRDRLDEIKKRIQASHQYFYKNNERFNFFMKFVFETSLSDDDYTKLEILNKPTVEFNILEAMISRLRGEFLKQEPSINLRASDGIRVEDLTPEFLKQMEVIEAHFREIFFSATTDALEYNVYSDLLAGGFSVVQVFTDYINELSFEQNIRVERVFDPTLTGFDPLARMSHKGDGAYAFHLIPKSREEFEEEYGTAATKGMRFTRSSNVGGFNWSYVNQDQEIILLSEYYEKVKKKERIALLSNGHVIIKKHYDKLLEMWNKEGFIEQAPIIIKERNSEIETIERYIISENEVLDHNKTNFKHIPLVFIDGNSVVLKQSLNGASVQFTRPFVYHAKGVQMLKNFAGQTVANEIENMVLHKFKVAVEAIPDEYQDAYKNVQQASTLVYNAFYKDNPEVRLEPPMEIQRTATPPIVENTFMGTDRTTQVILGSYDSTLAINDKQVSGVAIQQGALQSNAAALPYLKGYVKGWNRVLEIIMDLIPKYYVTPRSLPVMQKDGKRSYQVINRDSHPGSIDMKYNPNHFQVKVEVGLSAAIQKQVALEEITKMMQASPLFAEFINTMGLETILSNMDIRGIEELKAQAVVFMQQLKEKQAQAAEQGNPTVEMAKMQTEALTNVEMAKIEQQRMKAEGDMAIQAAKVANEKEALELKFIELMAKIDDMEKKMNLEQHKVASEDARTAVEHAMEVTKAMHEMIPTTDVEMVIEND